MADEVTLANARIVLPDRVIAGALRLRGGAILAVEPGATDTPALDMEGDLLLPGIVDLHTDNLERQVLPRHNARWPSRSALIAHDAQCAAAGVTTVLDALCLGDLGFDKDRMRTFHDGVVDLDAMGATGLLKAEHFLHLRCELPAPDMLALFDGVAGHARIRLVSLMDHCPGYGQYADLDRVRALKRRENVDAAAIERFIVESQANRLRFRESNRAALLQRLAGQPAVLASHDDRTAGEVADNAALGINISEFPVTLEAAHAARAAGMRIVAGAPNLVRGGSHSGNVAAAALLAADAVDAFASDYVPSSLIEAIFAVHAAGWSLPDAVALVSAGPAAMAGLADRGRLVAGQRADVLRVRLHEGLPVVRAVWRAGERVA